MKRLYVAFCLVIILMLASLGLATFALPDKDFSEYENRYLQQKPSLREEDFTKQLTDYLGDQFPFRISAHHLTYEIWRLLGKTDINGVYVGKNHYYFQKILDSDINEKRYQNNLLTIEKFIKSYPTINTTVMIVPTAVNSEFPTYSSEKLYDMISFPSFIDLRDKLKDYYRTDHHWTLDGAYVGYREYCKEKNLIARSKEDFQFEIFSEDFLGTLYSKVVSNDAVSDTVKIAKNVGRVKVIADGKEIPLYDMDAKNKKDKYLVYFGGNHGVMTLTSANKNGKNLLVIKDSFANSFLPLIVDDYEKIIVIDPRYYSGNLEKILQKESYTDALFLYEMYNFSTDTALSRLK
ncbi:hypothetical protein P261_00748 [Lachnospiraceae bacterium TWA4]|nr:hypothetical protein P261_00748 [Lachnospiraceae bacterium TWA4]